MMQRIQYSQIPASEAPAAYAVAITPADTDLANITRSIYVGTAGSLVVIMCTGGASVTFTNVPAGSVLPIMVKRITAATTAGGIVALY
jgi:hypothetical protein